MGDSLWEGWGFHEGTVEAFRENGGVFPGKNAQVRLVENVGMNPFPYRKLAVGYGSDGSFHFSFPAGAPAS